MSKRKTTEITQKRCHSFLGNVLDILVYKTFSKNQNTTISCFEEPLEQCLKSICPRENHRNHSKMAEKTVPLISGRPLGHQPSEGGVNRGPSAPGTKKYPRKRPYKNDK